jgi:HlyD family secretion protein
VIAQNLSDMQVDASIDESDVGRIRTGQKASFTVDAYPGQTFEGEVKQVRKAAQNVANVVTYVAVVGFTNTGDRLLPGMTANVRLVTDLRENVLKVPNAALRVKVAGVEPAGQGASAAGGVAAPGRAASATTGSAAGGAWWARFGLMGEAFAQSAGSSGGAAKGTVDATDSGAAHVNNTGPITLKPSTSVSPVAPSGAAAPTAPAAAAAGGTSAGPGGGQGGQLGEFRNRLLSELQLAPDQIAKVDALFADVRPKFAPMRDLGAEERPKARERIMNDMRARIGELLSPEQKAKYAVIQAEAAGRNSARGRIYLMGADGKPAAYNVRLGITDGTSTELMVGPNSPNAELFKEGALVIIATGTTGTAAGMAAGTAGGQRPSGPRMPF